MLFFFFFLFSSRLLKWCRQRGGRRAQPTENVLESYLLGKSTDQLPPERLFINKKKKKEKEKKPRR